ncbi:MAG: hypothetical protein K2G45_08050 [Lachnospiraceae bacterium]|nr:hypothetical protein [Lachnospiraceae bacterium]
MRNIFFRKTGYKIIVAGLMTASLLLCCSCGNKKEDIEYFGTEESGASNGDAADKSHVISDAPIAEQIGAQDKWDERINNANSSASAVNIHAVVNVPNTNIVNVAEAKAKKYDEEEQKEILKSLKIENAELDEEEYDGGGKVSTYTFNEDGYNYCMIFYEWDWTYGIVDLTDVIEVEEGYVVTPFSTGLDAANTDYNISDNRCTLTQDEVEDLAYDFVKKLGLRDFEITKISAKSWEVAQIVDEAESVSGYMEGDEWIYFGQSESFYDGAEIRLSRRMEGMHLSPVPLYAINTAYDEETDTWFGMPVEREPLNEELSLIITDKGVVSAHYSQGVEITEITDRSVALMSFDDICASMREHFEKYEIRDSLDTFKEMRLMYYGASSEDDEKYEVVPAWVLIANATQWIAVDARDGSLICSSYIFSK